MESLKAPYPEGELCDREGSMCLAKTEAERLADRDPCPSLEERYGVTRRTYSGSKRW
jgi:hypothetical protein